MRRFLLVANRARTSAETPLDDLPGAGGRFDLVARFVASTLLVSHGVRRDTTCTVLLGGPPNPPRALRIDGGEARWLRPDERAVAGKLLAALRPFATPVWQPAGDGIMLSRLALTQILDADAGPIVLLDAAGEDGPLPEDALFVLGDDRGIEPAQMEAVRGRAKLVRRVGPVALQADQCAVVVHNMLDRAGGGVA